MKTIPICQTPPDYLYFQGTPVWTTTDADQTDAVEQAITSLGGYSRVIEKGQAERETRFDKSGAVAVFDPGIFDEAMLYAHLTHRRFRQVGHWEQLNGIADLEVILTLHADLSIHLLESVYEGEPFSDFTPGIISADNRAELRDKVLLKSLACALPIQRRSSWLHFFPTLPLHEDEKYGVKTFGGKSSSDTVRTLLHKQSDCLLVAKSHADGIDASFDPLILCSAKQKGVSSSCNDGGNPPACHTARYCHRLRLPLEQALQSDRLMAPGDIRTKLMVFNTCTGLLIDSPVVDFEYGFAVALLANPKIHALVTSWKLITSDREKLEEFSRELRSGRCLGSALARFNQRTKPFYALGIFGDPRLRFEKRPVSPRPVYPSEPKLQKQQKKTPVQWEELTFLDCYLTWQILDRQEETKEFEKFRQARQSLSLIKLQSVVGILDEASVGQLQEVLIDCIFSASSARGPMPMSEWSRFGYQSQMTGTAIPCFHCQLPAKTFHFESAVAGLQPRRTLHCPSCGIAKDLPVSFPDFELRALGDHQVEIVGLPALNKFDQAALMLHYPNPDHNRVWLIPPNTQLEEETIELPDEFFRSSPLFLTAFLVRGFQFGLAKIPFRGEKL